MEQKKHLCINCAMCDISNTAESTLAAYESIQVNAALVLTSQKTQEMIPKHHLVIDAATVMEKPEGTTLKIINGQFEILQGDVPEQPVALLVNGVLDIGKGTEEALKQYAFIHVNGSVTYPDSLSGKLSMLRVNGSTECYPADAIRLASSFVVDKTFRLRAKAGRYYARRRIVLLDTASDLKSLLEKGVRFTTRTAVLCESLAEAALPMFDEDVQIHLTPDGCAYVDGNATLNEALVKRWGSKLYIAGDLILEEGSAPLLTKLEYLKVLGSVQLPMSLVAEFSSIRAEYDSLMPVKGTVVRDKVNFVLDKGLMERHPEGITLIDCVNVKLDEQVPPEWIEEKLLFQDCVNVACAPHQRSAVEMAASGTAEISTLQEAEDEDDPVAPDTQVINTSEFRLL